MSAIPCLLVMLLLKVEGITGAGADRHSLHTAFSTIPIQVNASGAAIDDIEFDDDTEETGACACVCVCVCLCVCSIYIFRIPISSFTGVVVNAEEQEAVDTHADGFVDYKTCYTCKGCRMLLFTDKVCVCVCVGAFVCVCVCVHVYVDALLFVCLCVYVYLCVCG
jgi:hypothetical protein